MAAQTSPVMVPKCPQRIAVPANITKNSGTVLAYEVPWESAITNTAAELHSKNAKTGCNTRL
jgi:hypothetical protein